MKERARILRLPPCPPYDLEGTESWLSEMAARGWRLEPDDFFKVLEQNFHGGALELNKEVFMTGYRFIKEGGAK